MAFKGRLVLVGTLFMGTSALIGCSQPPAGQDVASTPKPAAEKLEIDEIVVRPVGKASDTPLHPAFPKDRLEIAFKAKGSTARAELSVKMIALAGGRTVRTDKVRLSAANAPVPSMYF